MSSAWTCPCCHLGEQYHTYGPPDPLEPGRVYCLPVEMQPNPDAIFVHARRISEDAAWLMNVAACIKAGQRIDKVDVAAAGRRLHDLAGELIKSTDEFATVEWLVEAGYAPPF